MPHAYQVTFDGKEPVLKKGKLEPVKITVDTRTGNKKVSFPTLFSKTKIKKFCLKLLVYLY